MSDERTVIRTRFAPSPSGHLHVGGARTALLCWAYAHGRAGKFVLRIEDTDQKRSSAAASVGFLEDLAWLGIEWDEGPEWNGLGGGEFGPYFQSERLEKYDRYLEQLIAEGKAYRAFETSEELDAARVAAQKANVNYRYDRKALELDAETVAAWVREGKPHVVRLKVPDGPIVIKDEVFGAVEVPADELDDFVIRKADGYPTYHFAVTVDDELMQVTHVIRGQEHLKNSAKHMLIQDALGFRRPMYAHMSLIFNIDGSKMSKRDKDKALREYVKEKGIESATAIDADRWSWWMAKKDHQLELDEAQALGEELHVALPEINVDDFRRAGYLPGVLVNFLALLGWNPGGDVEKFDAAFLQEKFDFDRVQKNPAKFDREKLLAFNLDAIQAMDEDAFTAAMLEHGRRYHVDFVETLGEERFSHFARVNQPRTKTLEDPFNDGAFFVAEDEAIEWEATKPVRKALINGEPNGLAHLEKVKGVLAGVDESSWTVEELEKVVGAYAEEHADGKLGKVAQPLRIAVSGGTISPAIFDTLAILGKASVLKRIERCLHAFATVQQ